MHLKFSIISLCCVVFFACVAFVWFAGQSFWLILALCPGHMKNKVFFLALFKVVSPTHPSIYPFPIPGVAFYLAKSFVH